MTDKLKTIQDIGRAVKQLRTKHEIKSVEMAERSGRSRDILHRLENGRDVSVSSLLDILRAAGYAIEIVPAGLPTMEQMRQMFAEPEDDDEYDATPRQNPSA